VTSRKLSSAFITLLPCCGFAQHGAGTLIQARATQVQGRLTSIFGPAVLNQKLFPGDGVRTLKRGFADIRFTDTSEIRLNERSDMVIEDSATMRRYALAEGAIWVRVAKGVRTVVRTPVGTATARGTVFTISADGTLAVLEGTVQFDAGAGMALVHAGQSVKFSPHLGSITGVNDPYTVVQPDTGFTSNGWFDHPGSMNYLEPSNVTVVEDMTREYSLYGDDTLGGFATGVDVAEGSAALFGSYKLGQELFRGSPPRGPLPVPEPPLVLLLTPGIFAVGLRFKRKFRA
jgi:hypothetical protein